MGEICEILIILVKSSDSHMIPIVFAQSATFFALKRNTFQYVCNDMEFETKAPTKTSNRKCMAISHACETIILLFVS